MPDESDSAYFSRLLAECRPGRSLPRELYTSPRVFERDLERIFLRRWNFVGHASRAPQPGDFFLYSLAGESIIIIRAKDGSIHALLNVCPHRGSRICLTESGHAPKLVCPYHAWCFDQDGTLLAARHLDADEDRSQLGLRRAQIRVVEDLIFVSLAEDPPDFEPLAADLRKFFGPHGLDRAKICERSTMLLRANWKIAAENFYECYHCLPTHPELTQVMSYVRAFDSTTLAEERREYTVRWEARARELGHVTGVHKREDGSGRYICRIPIREGFLTQSRDGRPVAPLMGDFETYDGGVTATMFYPLNWLVADNDYAMLVRFTPVDTLATEVELTYLVHQDAVEGRDYDVENITWLWRKTMEEDQKITEDNQAGVSSRYYRPGPHSREETALGEFLQWYVDQIR